MNYKKIIFDILKEYRDLLKEDIQNYPYFEESLNLVSKIIELRYKNESKAYGLNDERINDIYMAKKILNHLNLYINEMYLIDKEIDTHYYTVRKNMNRILNYLFFKIDC